MDLRESRRLEAVQAPVIPIIGDLVRATPGAISLGQGVVSYGPPPEATDAIAEFLTEPSNHKYAAAGGIPPLLEGLRKKLAAENSIASGDANPVFVTAGGNMAFVNALLAIADPGDEVVLQSPYYFNHEMAVAMANVRAVVVPTDKNHQLQPARIREALTDRTRAVVTISPNNPSGAVYPEAALREVNALCAERGVYHVHDEAYEYFTWGDARHFSPGSIPGSEGHTISLFSFSKAYGFASWRIGYMVMPAPLLGAVRKIQDTILICPPIVSQFAAVGALRAGAAYCRGKRPAIGENRNTMLGALEGIADLCTVPPADGAFYFLLNLRSSAPSQQLAERLIREHRVAAIPGSAFGLAEGCTLRVAYGALEKETAAEGIDRLIHGLRTILGKSSPKN